MTQKTALHQNHLLASAKMAPFAGYEMPIQYADGVLKEHEWTRESAGLFDVSHMGQAMVAGAGAAAFLSRLTPSSFLKTPNARAKYTVLTNQKGGIIDDLIITRMNENTFFVVYNAGRKDVDVAWFKKNLPADVTFTELTNALVALQGPKAEAVLAKEISGADLSALGYMTMCEATWNSAPIFISRLGYTGEDGFEISIGEEKASPFWHALLKHTEVKAIGLAARDSLRLEMGYPLYGHDLNESTTPIEASLGWVMTKGHGDFIGANSIPSPAATTRVGIKITGAGIAREGATIHIGSETIGTLTSGGFSPSLKIAIGQGYIKTDYAKEGQAVEVEVRGKRISAVISGLSFVNAKTKQLPKTTNLKAS
jgi:aminomethyltransferase